MEPKSWRDVYKIHPCAAMMPRMSDREFRDLVEDLKHNPLRNKIVVVWQQGDDDMYVLDGISRLDALESLGHVPWGKDGRLASWAVDLEYYGTGVSTPPNLAQLVISLNLHRRHITAEQKIKLATDLIAAGKKWKWGDATASVEPQRAILEAPRGTISEESKPKTQKEEITERILAGESRRKIAESLHVSPATITEVKKEIPENQIAQACAERFSPTQKEIAAAAGVHRNTVSKYNGTPKPKRKKEARSIGAVVEFISANVMSITRDVKELLPHKEALRNSASLQDLYKKIANLHDAVSELMPQKRKTEPMRTATVLEGQARLI